MTTCPSHSLFSIYLHLILFSGGSYDHWCAVGFSSGSSSCVLVWVVFVQEKLHPARKAIMSLSMDGECLVEGTDAKEAMWCDMCTTIEKHAEHCIVITGRANFAQMTDWTGEERWGREGAGWETEGIQGNQWNEGRKEGIHRKQIEVKKRRDRRTITKE